MDVSHSNFIKEVGWPQVHGEESRVAFTIQSGPIKEFGVNGCQIDDVIAWAKEKIEGFNAAFPCRENAVSREELKASAMECLAKAFKGDEVPAHVVQAATAIILTPEPKA